MNIRLEESYQNKVNVLIRERKISQTKLIKEFIDANYYMSRPEIVQNSIHLMEAIDQLHGECDTVLWNNLKEAGENLCQSLLIK